MLAFNCVENIESLFEIMFCFDQKSELLHFWRKKIVSIFKAPPLLIFSTVYYQFTPTFSIGMRK